MEYSYEQILCAKVMHRGDTSVLKKEELEYIDDAVLHLSDAYKNKNTSEKDFNYYTALAEIFVKDIRNFDSCAVVYFITEVSKNNISETLLKDLPEYKLLVIDYSNIIRQSRSINLASYEARDFNNDLENIGF